jgi:hypothetical protein
MLVKVVNENMINCDHKFQVELNEIEDFESEPDIVCAPGIYFCEAKYVFIWALKLGYEHICDVEIPDNALVLKFDDKNRTNKIILSRPIPLGDHPMWHREDICLEVVKIDGEALKCVKKTDH